MSSNLGLVGPPTAAMMAALQLLSPACLDSIDHLLELLHRESADRLACWLRFEDARLFREGVHTLASWTSGFLLELHVPNVSEFTYIYIDIYADLKNI